MARAQPGRERRAARLGPTFPVIRDEMGPLPVLVDAGPHRLATPPRQAGRLAQRAMPSQRRPSRNSGLTRSTK